MRSVQCFNEYDPLKTVLVCEPCHLMKEESLQVSIDTAIKQHHHLVSTLKDYGVEVLEISAVPQFPEQVFTRDIGFVLGREVLVSKVSNYRRQGEEDEFKSWLQKEGIPFFPVMEGTVEGGDVLIDGDTVYVGLSNRTNREAAQAIQKLLPHMDVMEVPFTDHFLHLDCVFNILSPTEAIIYSEEIHGERVQALKKRYDFIEVTKEEQACLATNVLSIGDKRVISIPNNKSLNLELGSRGYEVIEVDLTEILKFGGSFRCCTLPLFRSN
ncbi:dimethylarginine dimethylaminohydrolase family protein [Robertmurraya kyonggiensis]|nr:arginine deiminase family protein [Robertmurraya kyonggiensis]